MRIKFREGKQREFFDLVIEKLSSPSLRGLLQFGLKVNYSTLKNYYNEDRLISEELFLDLCGLVGVDSGSFGVERMRDNWGRVLGGKKSKRRKSKKGGS